MTCHEPDCPLPHYAKGFCSPHYKRLVRAGSLVPEGSAACSVEVCDRAASARGWCHGHYLRFVRGGDVRPDEPLVRPAAPGCSVADCGRPHHAKSLCLTHYRRLTVTGDPGADIPVAAAQGTGFLKHGYWHVPVAPEERWLVHGATNSPEHRLVMARVLGRPLRPDESVHHVNGQRRDNRAANLELWSRYQPSGQRAEDLLAWAYELIRRYDQQSWALLDDKRPDHE